VGPVSTTAALDDIEWRSACSAIHTAFTDFASNSGGYLLAVNDNRDLETETVPATNNSYSPSTLYRWSDVYGNVNMSFRNYLYQTSSSTTYDPYRIGTWVQVGKDLDAAQPSQIAPTNSASSMALHRAGTSGVSIPVNFNWQRGWMTMFPTGPNAADFPCMVFERCWSGSSQYSTSSWIVGIGGYRGYGAVTGGTPVRGWHFNQHDESRSLDTNILEGINAFPAGGGGFYGRAQAIGLGNIPVLTMPYRIGPEGLGFLRSMVRIPRQYVQPGQEFSINWPDYPSTPAWYSVAWNDQLGDGNDLVPAIRFDR